MREIILIVLLIVVAGFVVFVARRPKAFRITRSATLPVEAAAVFPHVNELRAWLQWSPWAKRDPAVKNTFSGPQSGVGAVFCWDGNRQVGAGRMTVIESSEPERVRLKLEFFKPFPATHTAEFTFRQAGGPSTMVTWTMTGENNFFSRAMCLFVDMDKMVGRDFEAGLENLRLVTGEK